MTRYLDFPLEEAAQFRMAFEAQGQRKATHRTAGNANDSRQFARKGGRGVSLLPRLLLQSAIDANQICGMDTDLPVHPSRMFGAYRFAEGNSFLQEIINLGHDVMVETKLIEKIVY